MLFRHAIKELDWRFSFLFLGNLALGLSGLIAMEAYRTSLSQSLRDNAQNLLAADLAVSTRRAFTEEEKKITAELSKITEADSEIRETFSMVQSNSSSRLVQLKAIGENFPLRGFIELKVQGKIGVGEASQLLRGDKIWVDVDLAKQLQLEKGSNLRLGKKDFLVDDFISADPTQSFRGLALSGRILLSLESLEKTELIRAESTVSFVKLYRLQDFSKAKELATEWSNKFPDPAIRVQAAGDSADDSGRMLSYLGDFLGLSSLVALFLSSLGSAYLFRTWLLRRSRIFAIQQVLGLSFLQGITIPILQIFFLSIVSLPLAFLLGAIELKALQWLIQSLSPVEIRASLSFSSFLVAFSVSAFGSLFLALPFLFSLRSQNPRELLSGHLPDPKWTLQSLFLFFPSILFFAMLSVYEARSFRTAGIFLGSLLLSLIFLAAAGFLFLFLLRKLAPFFRYRYWPLHHAILHLSRRGAHFLSAFVALALGVLLLNLLPQLRSSLISEVERPDQKTLPAFFLFDIQQDQLEGVKTLLGNNQAKLENTSALVRARLLKVNGEEFERGKREEGFRTREEENEARFRNRGFNLSYRNTLKDSEILVAGNPIDPLDEGIPQISLEQRFADRLKLKIGDLLDFDVQGVEVKGRVVNLRKVRWTSFQPNFFVVFEEGILEEAPQIFLGSILAHPKQEDIQSALAKEFPNISVIDVKATVARGLDLLDKMRWCLNLMSVIALFAGFVVLFSIANRQAEVRVWEGNLVKVLGARKSEVRAQHCIEFLILSVSAGGFGAALSLALSWISSIYFFEGSFSPSLAPLFYSIFGTAILGVLVAIMGGSSSWQRNPAEILNDSTLS
jgi:putative ABC transport system permease protein